MSGMAVQPEPEAPVITERGVIRRGAAKWLRQGWIGKGFWGMLDMGLFAGGNFLTHVFLARWLPEPVYGAFTTAFAVYLLSAVVHTSVIIEPMMVYGSKRYHRRLPGYLGSMFRLHLKLCAFYAAVLLAIAGVQAALGEFKLAGALLVFAGAQFTLLLPWVLRDACYINADPKPAGIAGAIYVGCVVAGLFAVRALGWLSLPSAVAVLGGSALVASVWLMQRLALWSVIWEKTRRWRHARSRHWRFGRWATLTNFIRFVPEHLPLIVVPAVMGYAAGGALKAMINLITPFVLATWALSMLMLPVLVRRKGTPGFERSAAAVAALVMVGPLLCWPVLGYFSEAVVGLLYAGKFVDEAWVLWLMGLLPVVISLNCIVSAMFRALDRPGLLLPGAVASAIAVVVVGFPLLWWVGLWGMVLGMLLAQTVNVVVMLFVYTTRLRESAIGRRPIGAAAAEDDVPAEAELLAVGQEMVS